MIKIIRTDSQNTDFQYLVSLLDQDLRGRDGEEHPFYAQFNKIDTIKQAVVAYQVGVPAGCGALRAFDKQSAEIKRMFVLPEYRGQGIAKLVLAELEACAKALNFSTCILETGKKQPEAVSLYQRSGYVLFPNYGQYENIENSLCMKKAIRKKVD